MALVAAFVVQQVRGSEGKKVKREGFSGQVSWGGRQGVTSPQDSHQKQAEQ